MDKAIVFKDWKELQAYMQEIIDGAWEVMEHGCATHSDGWCYVMERLENKVKEDFGGDTPRTA